MCLPQSGVSAGLVVGMTISLLFLLALLLLLLWFFFPVLAGVTVRVVRNKPQDPEQVSKRHVYHFGKE